MTIHRIGFALNIDPISVSLLDHGYVKLIPEGCWGSDRLVIEAARMSTNKGFLGWDPYFEYTCQNVECKMPYTVGRDHELSKPLCPNCDGPLVFDKEHSHRGDYRLLQYLWKNGHHTPFEMGGLTFEVQAPLFVFREWHRHRTQSYNELSARYTELPELSYVPSIERLLRGGQSGSNHQSSGAALDRAIAERAQVAIRTAYEDARESYRLLLGDGVSRELARLVMPVNQYSRMRASSNLRNWLHFLTLRTAEGAQWEIRQYAAIVGRFVKQLFPRTYELWDEGR